jgi:hypothetical protein
MSWLMHVLAKVLPMRSEPVDGRGWRAGDNRGARGRRDDRAVVRGHADQWSGSRSRGRAIPTTPAITALIEAFYGSCPTIRFTTNGF